MNYDEGTVQAATAGDEAAFGVLAARHRRELHLHCYRMLGSFHAAEDCVQETMLRAWRKRETFEGRSTYRAWLYRIATNTCLELLRRESRKSPAASDSGGRVPPYSEMPWLQPYPDALLDELVSPEEGPEEAAVAKETIALAYLAAIQLLPPTQRAVLILRDVLDFSAAETASLLETTVASANSSLQRARTTMARYRGSLEDTHPPTAEERAKVQRYIEAHDRLDPEMVIGMLREDARLTISPMGMSWEGRDAIAPGYREGMGALGDFRSVPVSANRDLGVAHYLRRWGETEFKAFSLVVLAFRDGEILDFATFIAPDLFAAFGLPPEL